MAKSPEDTSKTGGASGASGGGSDGGIAKFSEEERRMLECPVCLQLPRQKPIYQVWSLTQLFSVGFHNEGSVRKSMFFYKHSIEVCFTCYKNNFIPNDGSLICPNDKSMIIFYKKANRINLR